MATKLTDEEKLRRANELLTEVVQLLANEPTESHRHGGWIVKIRSLIGKADRYRRKCKVSDETTILDARADKLWKIFQSKRR